MGLTRHTKIFSRHNTEAFLPRYHLLAEFMENIPDVIYFKDKRGRLLFVNKAHAKGLGLRPEGVVGKTDFDIFPKARAELMAKDDQYVFKTGKPIIDKIERATRPDSVDNYVSTTKIPRRDAQGKVIGLIGITRDITRRVNFEQAREAKLRREIKWEVIENFERLKAEFVSMVSHELRTPLAIIQQLLGLMAEEIAGPINSQQRDILRRARKHMVRLKILMDELLDISRIESKRLRLHYSLVNLNEIFKDSELFFKQLAKEKGVTLTYHLPGKGINIFIDAERIAQVISNLINNAIKFTEENGRIRVEVKALDTKVRIEVVDTGIGIAKADLPKIFEKFVQVGPRGSAEKKGIGLGLSIVKELVEKHGGEIWVESQLGVGSKFYFTLPCIYTARVLGKSVKNRINELLQKKISVYLVNLLVVNYEEFVARFKVERQKLAKDLNAIIDEAYDKFFSAQTENPPIMVKDIPCGKYSIILPQANEGKIVAFCDFLRGAIRDYFIKRRIEDVFIALGMLSYPVKKAARTKGEELSNLKIKEIYVGSEMRRSKRIDYRTKAVIVAPAQARQIAETLDVSKKGICFLSKKLLETDVKITVEIELLKSKKTICPEGCVRWIRKIDRTAGQKRDVYKTGFEFTSLVPADKRLLDQELKIFHG
jgi:PAS domain S-box-containing protein